MSSPIPSTSHSSTVVKPLPSLPIPTITMCVDEAPYRDDPSSPIESCSPPQHHPSPVPLSIETAHQQLRSLPFRPYTDLPSPSEAASPTSPHDHDHDGHVPLVHLVLHSQVHALVPAASYPLEAPPSYSVAVRQQSIAGTLHHHFSHIQNVEIDEESGMEMDGAEDLSHPVEKVLAMLALAVLLLVVSAVLAWTALGSGLLD